MLFDTAIDSINNYKYRPTLSKLYVFRHLLEHPISLKKYINNYKNPLDNQDVRAFNYISKMVHAIISNADIINSCIKYYNDLEKKGIFLQDPELPKLLVKKDLTYFKKISEGVLKYENSIDKQLLPTANKFLDAYADIDFIIKDSIYEEFKNNEIKYIKECGDKYENDMRLKLPIETQKRIEKIENTCYKIFTLELKSLQPGESNDKILLEYEQSKNEEKEKIIPKIMNDKRQFVDKYIKIIEYIYKKEII